MTLPDSLDLPELVGGKYRPIGVIGVGAMGTVYQVEHILTGELLALKVMTAHQGATREAIERFKREARASSKIKSEHVVRVTDADVAPELDRAPYLVMDFLDGADLEKASADLPVPPAEVVEWMRQIARALDKAHRLGITHRDLKPENLFLTQREDGSPLIKILDFGIAKIAAESTGTTQTGQFWGRRSTCLPSKPGVIPIRFGPSSDLYALGLITFKLLTGAPYWKANSVAGIIGRDSLRADAPPGRHGLHVRAGVRRVVSQSLPSRVEPALSNDARAGRSARQSAGAPVRRAERRTPLEPRGGSRIGHRLEPHGGRRREARHPTPSTRRPRPWRRAGGRWSRLRAASPTSASR